MWCCGENGCVFLNVVGWVLGFFDICVVESGDEVINDGMKLCVVYFFVLYGFL